MGSSCVLLWGSEVDMSKVAIEILHRLEYHRDFLQMQPLQVLAYEANLLANQKTDTNDDVILAKNSLCPLLKRKCLHDENDSMDEEDGRAHGRVCL